MNPVLIIGSGLTGATAAHRLRQNGIPSRVVDSRDVWGGQLATESIGGILYEPHGAHIFHTRDSDVWQFVTSLVEFLPFRHHVKTEVNGRLLSWPPQLSELRELPEWPQISAELDARPAGPPAADNFEDWCVALAGRTLYQWFIKPYTEKQWGTDPRQLAASWAPKRIELRDDDYTDLFRDPHQGWPKGGYRPLIDALLTGTPVTLGVKATAENLADFGPVSAYVVTAPLDDFFGERLGPLPWRGVRFEHEFIPGADRELAAPVVNHPGLDEAYTRRIETKWMSGQTQPGTVVTREYPGHPARHYPVDDAAGQNRALARRYAELLDELPAPAVGAGRLATYTYIDMDQAIRQGMNAAEKVQRLLRAAA